MHVKCPKLILRADTRQLLYYDDSSQETAEAHPISGPDQKERRECEGAIVMGAVGCARLRMLRLSSWRAAAAAAAGRRPMGVAWPKASLLACCTTARGSRGCRRTSRTPGAAAAQLLGCPWPALHNPCRHPHCWTGSLYKPVLHKARAVQPSQSLVPYTRAVHECHMRA